MFSKCFHSMCICSAPNLIKFNEISEIVSCIWVFVAFILTAMHFPLLLMFFSRNNVSKKYFQWVYTHLTINEILNILTKVKKAVWKPIKYILLCKIIVFYINGWKHSQKHGLSTCMPLPISHICTGVPGISIGKNWPIRIVQMLHHS